ncbi:MAG: selenium metabolism-associated LysR family transcriptional regulator [bacterium]|nr:selenium metabolism-associated LysR family transcriptional regulator [bacterium]
MELRYLDIFCRVYEKKSFSRAAESLYLTQPTISAHIKSLEEELGIKVFDRLGRQVLPTKAGELLYSYARKIEGLGKEAKEAIALFTGSLKGRLHIGGSTIPGEYLLPEVIGNFRRENPDVYSNLHIGDTKDVTAMLIDGRIELGVVGAIIDDSRIENMKYSDDELILIAAPSYDKDHLTNDMISSIPFIARERGSGSWLAIEKAFSVNGMDAGRLSIVAEMGSTEAVKTAVRSGLGLSIVSTLAVKDELARGSLKMIDIDCLPIMRELYIITHKMKVKSPLCQAFFNFISNRP